VIARTLDHVALWVEERDAVAELLTACCGMHEIERTDDFTLVGGDAREGKVTLFAADGPREQGLLERVVIRVPDLETARERLAGAGVQIDDDNGGLRLEAPGGVPFALVHGDGDAGDLDHVALRVPDPEATAARLVSLGMHEEAGRLAVGDRAVVLREGDAATGERPLLNHVAFLVDGVDAVAAEARERGLEIDREVDAENTRAVFLVGPDGILLEYVEQKPGFSLA
jgi:catechol 2,3-dioxygenase-like lactoylglutathione lyase family enzyme